MNDIITLGLAVNASTVQQSKLEEQIINDEKNRNDAENWTNNTMNMLYNENDELKKNNRSCDNKLKEKDSKLKQNKCQLKQNKLQSDLKDSNIKVLKNTIDDLENRDTSKLIKNYVEIIQTYKTSDLSCEDHEELIDHYVKIISINQKQKKKKEKSENVNKIYKKFECKICFNEEISFLCCSNNHCMGDNCKKNYDDDIVGKVYNGDYKTINTCPLCKEPINFKKICL